MKLAPRHLCQAIPAKEIQQICVAEDRSLRDEIGHLRAEHKLQLENEIAKVHTAWEPRIKRQDSILSFMRDSMGHLTRRNDERTNYGEDLRLLREDVNRILEIGVTQVLTEMVQDLRDRVDTLEEFVTINNSDPTGFMDMRDPCIRPGRSTRCKTSVRKSNTQLGSNIDISLTLVTRTQRIAITPVHRRPPLQHTLTNLITLMMFPLMTFVTSLDPGKSRKSK